MNFALPIALVLLPIIILSIIIGALIRKPHQRQRCKFIYSYILTYKKHSQCYVPLNHAYVQISLSTYTFLCMYMYIYREFMLITIGYNYVYIFILKQKHLQCFKVLKVNQSNICIGKCYSNYILQ